MGKPAIEPRRLVVALVAGAVVAAAALGIASLLNEPAKRSAQDRAQPIIVGAVAGEPINPDATADPAGSLPPIAIVLDRPAPDGISRLEPTVQVARLREIVARPDAAARRWVELGHAYQALKDASAANEAYREAERRDPRDPAAKVGLAMVTASRGPAGLQEATTTLGSLAAANPDNQLVVFNRGWLALYRRDLPTILASWRRTVKLAPNTLLGRTATGLLRQVGANSAGSAAP